MILDDLQYADRYTVLHPGFAAGIAQLRRHELASLDAGRYPIDDERLVLIIGQDAGRGRDAARLEAHRRYIDIQFSIAGEEEVGWRVASECRTVTDRYDNEHDIAFFADPPQCWLSLSPGKFAIFFPEDAHAPLAGHGLLHKAVIKVAVDW